MTELTPQSALNNIVDDWKKTNEPKLLQGLEVKTSLELLRFENALLLSVFLLAGLIMAWILKTRIEAKDFQKRTTRAFLRGHAGYRHQSNKMTPVRTRFGNTVRIKCRYCVTKRQAGRRRLGRNGSGAYPALEALGIRHRATPALASEVARNVTDGPSLMAVKERFARWGIIFNIKVIKRISEYFAYQGLAVRNAWLKTGGDAPCPLVPENETLTGCRLLIGIDGGRLRTRKMKVGRIPEGNKRHGFKTDWREPKMLVIRILDGMGKVIRNVLPIYDGTTGNADAVFDLLRLHLKSRNIEDALEIICICDGAPWIWERIGKLLKELGVDQTKVSYALDYYHALEHITAVADGRRRWSQKKRTRWLNHMKGLLIDGKVDAVLVELGKFARGRNAPVVKRELKYFEDNKGRMHYDLLAEKKLPIGSGATESAVRQVVNLRMKGAGTFWLIENAEAFLHLRCYLKARRWDAMENAVFGYAR